MTHFVYIIKSEKNGKNYIGSTSNIDQRLKWHNAGKNTSTRYRRPFKLIYKREFGSKINALSYERWLKNQKGGFRVKELIKNWDSDNKES